MKSEQGHRELRPLRIALFTETFLPRRDGIVTRLTYTIEELSSRGDDVLVIAPHIPGLPTAYSNAQVYGLPCMPFPFYQGFYLGSPLLSRKARAALDRFAPEVVHAVNPFTTGVAALCYARQQRLPLVASYHTNIPEYVRRYGAALFEKPLRWYLRQLHNQAQLNLCTSPQMRDQLLAQGLHNVELWEPGVDIQLFNPERRSETWRNRLTGGCPETTILLYVGRLAQEKGLGQILAVLPKLSHCHVAFVGDGPQASALKHASDGLPVTFLGSLYGEDLAAAYAAADIFVFPSSTETLGLVAIEAMASGLPVVGAHRGGLLNLIVDGETGLLFEPDSLTELYQALNHLINSPVERRSIAHAARRRAEQWSWSAATAGLRQHYTQLISGKYPI